MSSDSQPRPVAVFTGDGHLRLTTWADHPQLCGDAYIGMWQVVAYALQHSLPLILLGDTLDSARPDALTIVRLQEMLAPFATRKLPVYYVDGNHDASTPSWGSVVTWATHATQAFTIDNLVFYGMDFQPTTMLASTLQQLPAGVDVLLAHQSWQDIQGVGAVNGSFKDIPYGLTLLTGDYHKTGKWEGVAANGQLVTAYSPGSTAQQDLGETPDKFFGILYSDKSVSWVPITTRRCYMVTCSTLQDVEQLVQAVKAGQYLGDTGYAELNRSIIKVTYNADIPAAYAKLQTIKDDCHLFLNPRTVVTNIVVNNVTDRAESFANLQTAVAELATDPELRRDALTLLATTDIDKEIQGMRSAYMTQQLVTESADEVPAVST